MKRILRATPLEDFGINIDDLPPEVMRGISNGPPKDKRQERSPAPAKESKAKASAVVEIVSPGPKSDTIFEQAANDEPPEFLKNGLGVFDGNYEGFGK